MEINESKILSDLFLYLWQGYIDDTYSVPSAVIEKEASKVIAEIKATDPLITIGTLVDYMVCNVYQWRDINRWQDRWQLNWVFGKKAVERFKNQKNGSKYYQDLWLGENDLTRDILYATVAPIKKEHPMRKYIETPHEESIKQRFLNQQKGFVLCVSNTLMYAPSSASCRSCSFAQECIKILKTKYPELYRLRHE